jgi:YihY family inner membrane protein
MAITDRLRSFDRFQQDRRVLGFVVAVLKKYSDDQGSQLAALITYYAFFSLFPLLLVATTVLGYVLQGDKTLQHQILNSFAKDIPLVGKTLLDKGPKSLRGSGLALGIGLATSLWAGLGITQALQAAYNRIWHVPFKQRPDFLRSRLRGALLLLALGGLTIVSTGLTGVVSAGSSGTPLAGIGAILLSLALNISIFLVSFRILTSIELTWRQVLPGAVPAGLAWEVLQTLGALLFAHEFKRLNAIYSTFATVIALLTLLYLAAQVTLIAAEVNVVWGRKLWPRGLMAPLTSADKRALTGSAETEERVEHEDVTVAFDQRPAD